MKITKEEDVKLVLHALRKRHNLDGVVLLEFSHTDAVPKMLTYTNAGTVPALDETILALVNLVAKTAYHAGHTDAQNEAAHKTTSNLDYEKV